MGGRFSIARKLGLSFGVMILLFSVVLATVMFFVNDYNNAAHEHQLDSHKVSNQYEPLERELIGLREDLIKARGLAVQWVFDESRDDEGFKDSLRLLVKAKIPNRLNHLDKSEDAWANAGVLRQMGIVDSKIRTLLEEYYQEVFAFLPTMKSYSSPDVQWVLVPMIENGGEADLLHNEIIDKLSAIIQAQNEKVRASREEGNAALAKIARQADSSIRIIFIIGLVAILISLIVATIANRYVVKPVSEVNQALQDMASGVLPEKDFRINLDDEIGDMGRAMNQLVDSLKKTTKFAQEVGKSNFDFPHKPLSEKDTLGLALVRMRDGLAATEKELETKVVERTQEIERQRQHIEQLYTNVTDSIRYAKRLQQSILPPKEQIQQVIPDSFVFYRAKDIVSGDFYWVDEVDGNAYFAVVDCTGHGVPGAMMSLVGSNGLNQAISEHGHTSPATIMDDLNRTAFASLNKDAINTEVRDGMDAAICRWDKKNGVVEYAGALNPLLLVRDGEVVKYPADKLSIGSFQPGSRHFTNYRVEVQKGDMLYLFSDGYADQFGGPKGKKFLMKNFRALLSEISVLPCDKQMEVLKKRLAEWKGNLEQVDDILVMGVRI